MITKSRMYINKYNLFFMLYNILYLIVLELIINDYTRLHPIKAPTAIKDLIVKMTSPLL